MIDTLPELPELPESCASCANPLPVGARFCPACGQPAIEAGGGVVKLATVVFADLAGSTAWAEDRPPDEVRELLTDYLSDMASEVAAHGGTVDKFTGDGIMADFGVPTARDDDAVRAVRAALGMQRRAAAWMAAGEDPLRLRVGVNSGEVSTGGPFGREVLVMGSTVNVASRLQTAAVPGEVLVSDRTARLVERVFELEPVAPLDLKGVTGLVQAYVVRGERAVAPSSPRFVGRQRELAALEASWRRWSADRVSRLVVLTGDAGVGKTRLIEELARRLGHDAPLRTGRCLPDMRLASAWPLRAVLCSLLEADPAGPFGERARALDALTGRWSLTGEARDGIAILLGVDDAVAGGAGDPARVQALLLAGWRAAARRLADERSVVVLEDLHWADATTFELLGATTGGSGPLVLGTARPELDLAANTPAGVEIIRLDALSIDDAAALVESLAPGLDPTVAQLITERTDGNPFFVEEAVARVVDGVRALVGDVPDTVRAVLHARLDQLSPVAHTVVQAAAVMGRRGDRVALAALLPAGTPLDDALAELERFALLSPADDASGAYAFRHELVRDVAYERLPRRPRGLVHRRVAEQFERSPAPPPELLAHHWLAAWEQTGDAALRTAAGRACLVGARHAYQLHAVVEGRSLATRAVELLEGADGEVDALEVAGDLAAIASDGDGAWAAYAAATSAAVGDAAAVARLAAKASIRATRWSGTMFRPPPAKEIAAIIELGLGAAGPGDGAHHAQLLSARAFLVGAVEGDLSVGARRWAEEAVAMAERLGDAQQLSIALDALNMWCTGRLGDAYRLIGRRLDLVPRLDVSEAGDVFAMAAWTAAVIGRHAEATSHATRCIHLARGRNASMLIAGLAWRVVSRCGSGDWSGALGDLAEIEQITVELRHELPPPSTMMAYGAGALIAAVRADTAEVARLAELLERTRKATADGAGRGRQPHLARALVVLGDHEAAEAMIVDDDADFAALNLQARCELVAATQRWDEVPAVLDAAQTLVQASELEALDAAADHLEGVAALAAGEPARARPLLDRAVATWSQLPAPWERSRSLLALATAARQLGDERAAARHEAAAARLRERLGID